MLCAEEIIFQQNLLEKAYFIVKMSGPADLGKRPKKPFSRRSNLSNDDIIPLYVNMYSAFCDLLHA